MATYVVSNLFVPFNINAAVTSVQVTHSMGVNTPPYHSRCWLLNFVLATIWMVLFQINVEDTLSMISQNNFEIWSDHSTLFHSQMTSGPETLVVLLDVVDI